MKIEGKPRQPIGTTLPDDKVVRPTDETSVVQSEHLPEPETPKHAGSDEQDGTNETLPYDQDGKPTKPDQVGERVNKLV